MRARFHHRDQFQGLFQVVRLLGHNSWQSREFCPHSKRLRTKEDRAAQPVLLRRWLLRAVPFLPNIRHTTDEPSGSENSIEGLSGTLSQQWTSHSHAWTRRLSTCELPQEHRPVRALYALRPWLLGLPPHAGGD